MFKDHFDIFVDIGYAFITMGETKKEKDKAKGKSTGNHSNVDEESDVRDLIKIVLAKLDNLTEKSNKVSESCEEKFKSCEFVHEEHSDKIGNLKKEIEILKSEMKSLKKENVEMKKSVNVLNSKISDFDMKFEMKDREAKRNNICIEGVIEKENLSMEKLVDELFVDLCLDLKVSNVCEAIYRKGKWVNPVEGQVHKSRPIIVRFFDPTTKFEIFKNLKKIAGSDKWHNVFINEDLTNDQMRKMKDLRSINGYARSVGKTSTVRGTSIIIDSQKFTLDELDSVPKEVSIRKAKQIEVENSTGVIFQSHHSALSNMAQANFKFEGKEFESAESAYQYKRALAAGKNDVASEIMKKKNDPYLAKRLCKNVKDSDEWRQNKEKIMRSIVEAKFNQDESCKKELLNTGNAHLYEGTSDKFWGCSIPIAKYKSLNSKNIPGKNKLGQILEDTRKAMNKK